MEDEITVTGKRISPSTFLVTRILLSTWHTFPFLIIKQWQSIVVVMKNTQRLVLNWKDHNSPWPRGLVSVILGGGGGGGWGGGQIWLMFLNYPYSQLHGISVTNIFQIRPFFLFPGELSWIRAPASIFWRTDPFLYHTCLTFALCCAQRP